MARNIVRINRPPEPTTRDPYAQISWVFHQMEKENTEPYAAAFRYAKNKYVEYLGETHADYSELKLDARFHLHRHWESDALIRFNRWLQVRLASKTRYSIYKTVRRVMDFAYAQRVIDTMVYHAPMYKGVRETDSRAAYSEHQQEIINAGLAKWLSLAVSILQGYQPTGKGIPYRRKNTLSSFEVDGQSYEPAEAAVAFNLPRGVIQRRIAMGWTTREAVGLDIHCNAAHDAKPVTVEGETYRSVSAAAKSYGVAHGTFALNLRMGYSTEQAAGLKPIRVLMSDERALLWSFENEYDCDAYAMLMDFHRRKLNQVAAEKRLRTLFSRWGVWPYVDDRLVMPLATELAMLTGLNIESLKMLQTDSFNTAHGLTGQAVITYRKKRSASRNRSEERTLHVDLLDVEEHFVSEKVADKVHRLIILIITITSRIRVDASDELKSRLFIFEDVEMTRSSGRIVIVGIDPRGKAATWYGRFAREEGLLDNFGADFSFNISRCRPTLFTNMVLAGASLFQIQVVAGHESIVTTATYLDEHRLQPAFNATMTDALEKITRRSIDHQQTLKSSPERVQQAPVPWVEKFHESLSGCGCVDPYSPSELVRRATKYKEGTPCKYWNMCIFCDCAIITESSLPKIIVYRERVSAALESRSPSIEPRRKLFEGVVTLIDGVLKEDVIFPKSVLNEARYMAASLDDVLVDQLIYQGI